MFIKRNPSRTENDDFTLNVQKHISKISSEYPKEAVPVYSETGELIGWRVQQQFD